MLALNKARIFVITLTEVKQRKKMKPHILVIALAVASFAGCSGPIPPMAAVPAPAQLPPGLVRTTHPDHSASWMLQVEAKKAQRLIYVADDATSDVYVLSYPKGNLVGTLTGFSEPGGLCVDKAGDVYVADYGASQIDEYAHGGTKRLRRIADTGYRPNGCAIDKGTGDLAVMNSCGAAGYDDCEYEVAGNVAIYKSATGKPTYYTDPSGAIFYFGQGVYVAGQLYCDGMASDAVSNKPVSYLARWASGAMRVMRNNFRFYTPGSMQWDGTDLAVGDGDYEGAQQSVIYRVAIDANDATLVQTIPLMAYGSSGGGALVVAPGESLANHLVIPSYYDGSSPYGTVNLLSYPAGEHKRTITSPMHEPVAVAVSPATLY